MITVKISYTITKEIELELTTREYCEHHANTSALKRMLAEEDGVDECNISLEPIKIIQGELDFKNLDR